MWPNFWRSKPIISLYNQKWNLVTRNTSQASELLGHMNTSTTKRVYRRGYSIVDPLSPSEPSTKKQSIEK